MNEPEGEILDPGVLDELVASVSGDRAFVVHLVETFLADSADQVDAVEAAVEADDAAGLVRPAHTLKSSSATVGATRLASRARMLEVAGRTGGLNDEARSVAGMLRPDWETAVAALRAWTAEE